MAGPERKFIDSVHRQIDPEWRLHKQSMTGGMSTNGTPDYYYECFNRYVWVEYKYVKVFPEHISMIDTTKKYALSALQRAWLNRAYNNLTRVAAVLGSSEGAIIFVNRRWEEPTNTALVRECGHIIPPRRVAEFIAGFDYHGITIKHNQDAGVLHEHAGHELHYRKQTEKNKR